MVTRINFHSDRMSVRTRILTRDSQYKLAQKYTLDSRQYGGKTKHI